MISRKMRTGWIVVSALGLLFTPFIQAEEKISDFPQPYTVQESTNPGDCLVWLKAGVWSTQVMQTDIHHCHSWKKGEVVHATFPNGDTFYLLVYENNKARKTRCRIVQTIDGRPLTEQYPITFTVKSSFISGEDCRMSVSDGQTVFDTLGTAKAGPPCVIYKPGVKLRGRLEREDGFEFIRFSADDGHIERSIVTGKQFDMTR